MIGGWVVPMGPLGRGGGYRADAGSRKGARANPPGTAFAEETSTWLATYILYGGSFFLGEVMYVCTVAVLDCTIAPS